MFTKNTSLCLDIYILSQKGQKEKTFLQGMQKEEGKIANFFWKREKKA